jgi:hypothetical protein
MKRSAFTLRSSQRLLGAAAVLAMVAGCYGTPRMGHRQTGGDGGAGGLTGTGGPTAGAGGTVGVSADASGTAGGAPTGIAGSTGGSGDAAAGMTGSTGGSAGVTGVGGKGGGSAGAGVKGGAGGSFGSRGGSSGAARGSHCAVAGDCANGICVEGVCCDTACDLKCKSCLKANTDQPDGTCALVRAGTSHASDCTAADVSTCGFDGTCDGAGACRKYKAGSVCKPQECPNGSSTLSPASTCDGKGSCLNEAVISCANYSCNAASNTCRSTCSDDLNCSVAAYCSTTTCIPKQSDGTVCARDDQCRSRTCGGRCCPAGLACMCPQPSATNLIPNSGFDADLSGWTVTPNDGSIIWVASDSLDCPFSGVARLSWVSGDNAPTISTCVPVQGGWTYNLGIRFFGAITCDINAHSSPNCADSPNTLEQDTWINGEWFSSNRAIQVPAGGVSLQIVCYPYSKGVVRGEIDMTYFGSAPSFY